MCESIFYVAIRIIKIFLLLEKLVIRHNGSMQWSIAHYCLQYNWTGNELLICLFYSFEFSPITVTWDTVFAHENKTLAFSTWSLFSQKSSLVRCFLLIRMPALSGTLHQLHFFEIQIENDASLVGAAWLYECYECSPTYPPITCVCVW